MTEAMGNYTVRTPENKVVLSSAASNSSPFYCPAERLEGHVGHKVSCVGYGDESRDYRERIHRVRGLRRRPVRYYGIQAWKTMVGD